MRRRVALLAAGAALLLFAWLVLAWPKAPVGGRPRPRSTCRASPWSGRSPGPASSARRCAPGSGSSTGGPAGIRALAAAVGEDRGTLEDFYEPYLIQEGFLQRTPRGRVATRRVYEHLGSKGRPGRLF